MHILVLRLLETLNIAPHTLRISIRPQIHHVQSRDVIFDAVANDVVVELLTALLVFFPFVLEFLALDFFGGSDECHLVVVVVVGVVLVVLVVGVRDGARSGEFGCPGLLSGWRGRLEEDVGSR